MIRRLVPVALGVLLLGACAPDPGSMEAQPATPTSAAPVEAALDTAAPEPAAPAPGVGTDPTPQASPTPSPAESMTPDDMPSASPSPTPEPLLTSGDDGDQVRELQHRLRQIGWFEGTIGPSFDDPTRVAVEGFQTKRGLPATGKVDQETWDRLVDMTEEPSHDELFNILTPGPALLRRGDTGDEVKHLQARLKQIGWFHERVDGNFGPITQKAVEGFQAKRAIPVTGEVDQRTLDRLAAMTHTPTTDELNNVVAEPSTTMTLDDRCLTGRVVCISKEQRQLAFVVDGTIRATMDVRFGSTKTPTRNGVFAVYWKSRDHISSLYDTAMPYAMFFSGGQAVHYSADFAARGYNGASHGCVNVRDKAAVSALFDTVTVGDTVVVY